MAGSGTRTVIQAAAVRPVVGPAITTGGTNDTGDALTRQERIDIRDAWAASRYGEIFQAVKGKAAVVSGAQFAAGVIEPRSNKVVPAFDEDGSLSPAAVTHLGSSLADDFARALAQVSTGPGGLARLIFEVSVCFDVEGSAVLVGGWVDEDYKPIEEPASGETAPAGAREEWRFVAPNRVTVQTTAGETVSKLDGAKVPESTVLQRCTVRWPDSPTSGVAWVRAALEPYRDLLVFTMAQRAMAKSNIPADLMLAPDEANPDPRTTGKDAVSWADKVSNLIGDAAEQALMRSHAGGQVVGPVLSIRGAYVDKFLRVSLSKPVSAVFAELIEQAKHRINVIADEAVENIAGLGETNRWNAEKISDQAWRRWYGPMVREIASTLMQAAVIPLLEDDGYDSDALAMCSIWVDPSAIVGKPDQAAHAGEALKMGAIGHSGYRGATGFTADDAPTNEELDLIRELTAKAGDKTEDKTGDETVNNLVGSANPAPSGGTLGRSEPFVDPALASIERHLQQLLAAATPAANHTSETVDIGLAIMDAETVFHTRVMAAANTAQAAMWERLTGRARNQARSLGEPNLGPDVFGELAALGHLDTVMASPKLNADDAPGASTAALETETQNAAREWWAALLALPMVGIKPAAETIDRWVATAVAVVSDRLTSWVTSRAAAGATEPGVVPTNLSRLGLSSTVGEQVPAGLSNDPTANSTPTLTGTLVDMFGQPSDLMWAHRTGTTALAGHRDLDGKIVPIDGIVPDPTSPWGAYWVGDHHGCRCQTRAVYQPNTE